LATDDEEEDDDEEDPDGGKLHPWQRHSSAEINDSSLTPGHVKLTLWPALTTTV
jgi:hypothetical protein